MLGGIALSVLLVIVFIFVSVQGGQGSDVPRRNPTQDERPIESQDRYKVYHYVQIERTANYVDGPKSWVETTAREDIVCAYSAEEAAIQVTGYPEQQGMRVTKVGSC